MVQATLAAQCQINLRNQLGDIDQLVAGIESFAEQHAIPPRATGHFVLALDELVTNIISYAYADDLAHEITVVLSLWAGEVRRMSAEVIDDGRAYDPRQAPEPDLTASIEERAIGGLGVHFVRTVMDDIQYRRVEGCNRLTIAKTID